MKPERGSNAPGSQAAVTVVAAIIKSQTRLLICQRCKGDAFPLKWEFPGGKVNLGEDLVRALERELREELGVSATIGPEIYRTRRRYPELTRELELIFFSAEVEPAEVRNLAFEQILWLEPAKLPALDFLPADRELVEKLARGVLRLR